MASTVVNPGLEGIVVGETVLSNVEGEAGRLTYRGYDIHDLAENANFEEVAHLLLFGQLPTHQELIDFKRAARRAARAAVRTARDLHAIPRDAWPMDVLRTARLGDLAVHRRTGPTARTRRRSTPRST